MLDSVRKSTSITTISSKEIMPSSVDSYTGSWLEISASAFDHNIACFVDRIGPKVGIAIIIKSNGYGHGLQAMALLSQNNKNVSWIGTATLSEALRIRAVGITKPILVLSHLDADLHLVHGKNIALAVHDLESARRLSEQAVAPFYVHIKIDTGLSRFGICPEDAIHHIQQIMALPRIQVQGIYTHFAVSSDVTPEYIEEQNQRFVRIVNELTARGITIALYHAAKSVVAAHLAQARYSLVRLGAGAYGLCAQESGLALHQLLTWKARIIHIRSVSVGAYIGYNRTYQATRDMRIAVLPVGYYEGYPLNLSNKGKVFIGRTKQYAYVVGRVCMNQLMIDVTDCSPDLIVGDEVELLGNRPGITVTELARVCGSNNERELVARLNPLLTRIIV